MPAYLTGRGIAGLSILHGRTYLVVIAMTSGVARPSWFLGLSEVITRAECPGLQGAWAIQYRSGPFCAVSNGEFSKYCAKHNQHAKARGVWGHAPPGKF